MVCLYTRVDDHCDVIMREGHSQFEVELRRRNNILEQFKPVDSTPFSKTDENAEDKATRAYDKLLKSVSSEEE